MELTGGVQVPPPTPREPLFGRGFWRVWSRFGRDLEGNRPSTRSTEPSSLGGESDLYRRIAKALHGRPRMCSLLDQDGGTGVAQVVESKTIQSEGLDDRFEDSPVEVGVPQNRSARGGEDHPLWDLNTSTAEVVE